MYQSTGRRNFERTTLIFGKAKVMEIRNYKNIAKKKI